MSKDRRISFFESLDVTTRRDFLKAAAMAGVSASVLFGGPASALAGDKEKDISIMNTALGLEHQAIAAYTAGAGTKLLSDPVLQIAVKFMKQHQEHRESLASAIKKFGGKPVEAKANYDVGKIAADVGIKELKTEKDVIMLAMKLEAQATSAYFGVVPDIASKDVLKVAVSIMADEAQHTAILRNALAQDPVPSAFVS